MKNKLIITLLITSFCLISCSKSLDKTNNIKEDSSNPTKITIESQIIESSNMVDITKQLESGFKKNSFESIEVIKESKTTKKPKIKYLIIGRDVPNLYRAKLKTNKSYQYLMKKNNIQNESLVFNNQKIFY